MPFVTAKIEGDFRAIVEEARGEAADAIRSGISRASDRVKDDLRSQTRAAGLGGNLEKAWQVRLYPKSGTQKTLRPAGLVYSRAPLLHDVFIGGATISARRGKYLVIPTKEATAMGFGTADTSRKGGALSGDKLRRASRYRDAVSALGEENIRSVPLPRGRRLVIYRVPDGKGRGKVFRSHKAAVGFRRGSDVPLFLMIPQVRLAPRLDFEAIKSKAGAVLESELDASMSGAA